MPETRIPPELAHLVDARLGEGETWSSLVRAALSAYLNDTKPSRRPRQRRQGSVAKALGVALAAAHFEDRDAAAVGLAKSLAERLDSHPGDGKYLAQRLLATLEALRLRPASRLGVLAPADETPVDAAVNPLTRLRLQVAARKAGEAGIAAYLSLRSDSEFEGKEVPEVAAVTAALEALKQI